MTLRIEDYALIGDLGSAALVGRNGSIDWLCWPRFDTDACFAALIGTPENGRWLIGPNDPDVKITRRYRPNTLILETRFETKTGAAVLTDFMPPRDGHPHLMRILTCERGHIDLHGELILRFGYGATVPWVTRIDQHTMRAIAGPDMVVLRSSAPFRDKDFKTTGDFSIKAGDRLTFSLTYAPSHDELPPALDVESNLESTERYWLDWTATNQIDGPYTEAVVRSLITLKALTYAPTGGMVAAPTTSLPEWIGGVRNWDYRFCWLRDATLTLLALMNAGYYDEARAWRDWLLRAAAGSPGQIQIMYGIRGERRLSEWTVPWLDGYEKSQPVRIGNAAYHQLQLDIFGEVMDALHQARTGGLGHHEAGWDLECRLLEHLETIWGLPDEGIWEVRGERQHFTYSKVMAWVAFDRAIKSAELHDLPGPVAHWRAVRHRIHRDVCARGFDKELNSFTQYYGSKELDASLLLLPELGFLPPEDPRIRGTVEAVERHLMHDGLVLRYDTSKTDDGLPPGEGVFLACSFWLADAYLMLGRIDDAEKLFKRLLELRNDLGLLSEQYEPRSNRLVGNFPQAFSHLALVNTASNLSHYRKPAEQRSERPVATKETRQEAAPSVAG
ncbi:MAG: glycoside hydrolase family 15 protein [Proteobacteria bacterium]|nr:glycoside hydrolase family 15 protein [Pseudomonadota bacterium]